MPCEKTGCQVYLVPYDEFLYGDAFILSPFHNSKEAEKAIRGIAYNDWLNEVHDIGVFRIVARSKKPINGLGEVHFVIHDYDSWFDQPTFEGRSPGSTLTTNNFTHLGNRPGEPIENVLKQYRK